MKGKAEISEAKPGDVPGLDIVRRQAIETGLSDVYDRDDFADLVAEPHSRLRTWVNDKNRLVLVIKSDFTPFSYGVLNTTNGRIQGLYTAESYQNQGHARIILEQFESRARKENLEKITVRTPKNAVGFFQENGFKRGEETLSKDYELTLINMCKRLNRE